MNFNRTNRLICAKTIRFHVLCAFIVSLLCLLCPSSAFPIVADGVTNVIGNSGFESGLGTSAIDGIGNWDNTANRGISNPAVSDAPDGSHVLVLDETVLTAGSAGSFTFQTVKNNTAGTGVFVSFSALVRLVQLDADGTDLQLQIEFNDAAGTQISAANTGGSGLAASSVYTKLSVSATAPSGTKEIVFTIRLQGSVDTDGTGQTIARIDDAVGTISNYPIVLDLSASKPRVTRGGATFVSARIKNVTEVGFNNLEAVVDVPEGFNFIDSSSRLDGVAVNSSAGSRIYTLGTIGAGEKKELGFLLAASSIVQIGKKYDVTFLIRDASGNVRSAVRRLVLVVVSDPVFDEGIIVGKVFDDQNENQVQDEGEHGVPGVKLATEEGIAVVTDPYGRYHIPAVKPARHVVKIDGHTLPKNTRFVTEEAKLVKTTEGMFNVVNFAVKLPEPQIPKQFRDQLSVVVSQGTDFTKPELDISLSPDILRMGIGVLEKDAMFEIHTNYAGLIAGWRIEVRDEFGDEVWTGYGLGEPPAEAPWAGKRRNRDPVQAGIYSYRLIVRDREGNEDWTPLKYFRVVSKLDRHAPDNPKLEVPAVGNFSIDRDGKKSIPTVAQPKILVRGETVPWNEVTVNGETAGVNLDGSFQKELYVPPGTHSVVVTTTDPEGNSLSYQEDVVVQDSYFFMVALGEQELGTNIVKGNLEAVGREKRFHEDFYEDGRAAYYLKAKIKGRFLVTSRYDTDDPRHDLFTNLDPDQYYPVYGDDSEIRYDAYDMKERLYVLVEMDQSFLKWGSFNTNFTQTDLATHSRTFSGLKAHYQSLATTRYGDPKRGFVLYTADADQLADHNEFLGTGGSLFYLRNKEVIGGSEKIRVEVRDKIQDITIYSRELLSGTDYEIDYPGGRVILRKPLSAVSFSDTIISNDILNGSDTYLVVDYEFDPQGDISDRNSGIRGFMQVGDHLRVGGTAIEDRRPEGDYDLRGLDLTAKFGHNTKVTAEYARSHRRTARNAVSFNGGITFTDLETGKKAVKKDTQRFDDAYLVKAETKLKTDTEISGYVQNVAAGFANADLIRQAGTRKAGVEIRQSVGEHVQLKYRFDRLKPTDPDNSSGVFTESPKEAKVHTAQMRADYENYELVAEYRNQDATLYDEAVRARETVFEDVVFRNALAGKFGYKISEEFKPYAKIQTTWGGESEPNHQFGGGIEASVMDGKGTVRMEEMAGTIGDSTLLGFDVQTSEDTSVYTTLRSRPGGEGLGRAFSATIGSTHQVNSRSRFYSEREYSAYREGERSASILGFDTQLTDQWGVGLGFERSQTYDIVDVNTHRDAVSAEIRYLDEEFLKIISRYELRYEGGSEDRIQWFFRDTIDWKISDDYRFSARFNRSDTNRFEDSTFHTDASFTEFNVGLAYRPVRHNRLNVLTRYTWLEEVGAESQFDTPDIFGIESEESAHIFSVEAGYELLPPWLNLVEKLAYRRTSIGIEGDNFYIGNFLWVNRFNLHVARKWDLILEYRLLWDFELLDALKHGVLVEIDREIMDYVRVGLGYNFTHFNDDLRDLNDVRAHGFFTRLSGKF